MVLTAFICYQRTNTRNYTPVSEGDGYLIEGEEGGEEGGEGEGEGTTGQEELEQRGREMLLLPLLPRY